MIKVLFICHGNICRSPMAEFVMKDMVKKLNKKEHGLSADDFIIRSAATSTEELGNPVHHGTRTILKGHGISVDGKYATQLCRNDYDKYDYIVGMDSININNIYRILECGKEDKKVSKLLDFAGIDRSIADPWYTGDFETTYNDVVLGCSALLEHIIKNLP